MKEEHSGNKYHRQINPCIMSSGVSSITVDVYNVIEAFDVSCPAVQHAVKKLLCAGLRGKGSRIQDLTEARDALDRAIVLQQQREQNEDT